MARLTPYAGTSHVRLADLINTSQVIPLPPSVEFEFDNVRAVTSERYGETLVRVKPTLYGKPAPIQDLRYLRLSLDVIWELPEGSILPIEDVVYPTTLHELLPLINDKLGLDLIKQEVLDYAITERPNILTLNIVDQCLAWMPGPYNIPVINNLPNGIRITQERAIRTVDTNAIRIITV